MVSMLKAELLRELFRSLDKQNEHEIHNALRNLIKFERERKNYALANELNEMIPKRFRRHKDKNRSRTLLNFNIPRDPTREIPLLDIKSFTIEPKQLIVPLKIKRDLNQIINQYNKRHVLEIYNLKNISKILFFGPPGCGKTLSAKLISSQLHLPLVYVRFDGLISSYLGETSANLRQVFDFVSDGDWILFFDEFDVIGKTRQDMNDNGEMKRVINSFLQQLDNYEGNAIIICATNFHISLDPAIWRRFDEMIFFDLPNTEDRIEMFKLFLNKYPHKDIDYEDLSERTSQMSGADIEQICTRSIKKSVIEESELTKTDLINEIKNQKVKNKYKTSFLRNEQNERKT
ncbi:MAG: AAA family ATPase [Candidatus Lokiarchaeota archaeon]|nr:AAA family ATPase [Candidatus Lokiarchaeota archaeon]